MLRDCKESKIINRLAKKRECLLKFKCPILYSIELGIFDYELIMLGNKLKVDFTATLCTDNLGRGFLNANNDYLLNTNALEGILKLRWSQLCRQLRAECQRIDDIEVVTLNSRVGQLSTVKCQMAVGKVILEISICITVIKVKMSRSMALKALERKEKNIPLNLMPREE
ncbi:hypothetical protein DSO57_1025905 [Entomophthora muscae]|uniref:Uncharacterized protein n=1 Tax=Entomophthora muscae TaxID=34485 RepID=A0ACC2RGT6_9FUNG|nr:hypothetical protein DSO57_1025905 [Entomophthora muscae]